jgi:L-ascorbate metabolism protein UlaG (beta-lactamase superfamily)
VSRVRCRAVQPALVPEDTAFPQLDFVCISHNHYDHLDTGQAPAAVQHSAAQHGVRSWCTHSAAVALEQSETLEAAGQHSADSMQAGQCFFLH